MVKFIVITLLLAQVAFSQDKVSSVKIVTDPDWGKEIITLPPSFAPDMQFRGVEDIRFSPGMFKADSELFFTYVFLLSGKYGDALDQKAVESEILKYYKGLGRAVGGKRFNVDPSKFSITLKKGEGQKFTGTLNWIEPFKTGKPQTLNLEITVWGTREKQFLFALVSPAEKSSEVWKKLTKIRESLEITKE